MRSPQTGGALQNKFATQSQLNCGTRVRDRLNVNFVHNKCHCRMDGGGGHSGDPFRMIQLPFSRSNLKYQPELCCKIINI